MSRFSLLILSFLFMAVPAAIVAGQPAPPADLLDALRLGGYVIVLRHGATNADVGKDGMSNPNKTAHGRTSAQRRRPRPGHRGRRGAAQARHWRQPCHDQSVAARGRHRNAARRRRGRHPSWIWPRPAPPSTPEESDRRADILRKLVGTHAGPDNLVIVTHKPNLIEAFGNSLADMREGEAAVFEPDVTGDGYRVVARFQASDWELLVQPVRRGAEPRTALRGAQTRAAHELRAGSEIRNSEGAGRLKSCWRYLVATK